MTIWLVATNRSNFSRLQRSRCNPSEPIVERFHTGDEFIRRDFTFTVNFYALNSGLFYRFNLLSSSDLQGDAQ
jgi:hypothetical protein